MTFILIYSGSQNILFKSLALALCYKNSSKLNSLLDRRAN